RVPPPVVGVVEGDWRFVVVSAGVGTLCCTNGLRTAPGRSLRAVDGVLTEIAACAVPPVVAGALAIGSAGAGLGELELLLSMTGTATSAATSARAIGHRRRSTRSLKMVGTGFLAARR